MGKSRSSWSYGLIRERLKDGSHALVLSEVYFHGRRPFGCALVGWRDFRQRSVLRLVLSDIAAQQASNYFLRATDDGLKRGARGRFSKAWLAQHKDVRKGSTVPVSSRRRKIERNPSGRLS